MLTLEAFPGTPVHRFGELLLAHRQLGARLVRVLVQRSAQFVQARVGALGKIDEIAAEAVDALFAEGNPTGVKCALSVMGRIGDRMRLPLVAGTPALEARMRELIRTYDLR